MMTECREARRHGDKLMGGKGMERYLPTQVKFKLRLPPCFVCNKGNCGYRVTSKLVSILQEGEGSGSGAIEESLTEEAISLAKLAGSSGDCR